MFDKRKNSKQWYQLHKKEKLRKNREWQRKNKKYWKEYLKQWHQRNKKRRKKQWEKRYQKNREKILAHHKKLYYRNIEKIKKKHKIYRKKNRKKINIYYRKFYRKNINMIKVKNEKRCQSNKKSWEGFIPKETNCEVCGKIIYFNQKRKNRNAVMCFDHRYENIKIKTNPTQWLRHHRRTPENQRIWKYCDFGMLCNRCNLSLPTKDREKFVRNLVKYVFKINLRRCSAIASTRHLMT